MPSCQRADARWLSSHPRLRADGRTVARGDRRRSTPSYPRVARRGSAGVERALVVDAAADDVLADAQALEDAACLVFLENEIGAFAAQHAEYPREKFVDILRKTWRKMSPAAQQAALGLELPPVIAALVREALG